MKHLVLLSSLLCSFIFAQANWSNTHLAYNDSCNRYQFEVTGTADSCFQHQIKVFKNGHSTPYYLTTDRNFSLTFNDTGHYYVRVLVLNNCNNTDTLFYEDIYISCSDSNACNWDFAEISYTDSCNSYLFELGSHQDSCIKYYTYIKKDGSITGYSLVSDNRLFSYTFTTAGTYLVKTIFYNSCNNCDTAITEVVQLSCGSDCNWDFAEVGYTDSCKKYVFEMGSHQDSCIKYYTYIKKVGSNNDYSLLSDNRVFHHTFETTGTYLVKTRFYNSCSNCDTVIVEEIHVECSGSCNWGDAGIYYNDSCRNYQFEMGSYIDSCVEYTSWIKKAGTNDLVVASYDRVFHYTFPSNGNYLIKTRLYNSCHNCDTLIYEEITVECEECDWEDAEISYNGDCDEYTFEMGSYISPCIQYATVSYHVATGTLDTIAFSRVFDYTFPDTGLYYISTIFYNACNGCDTFIYTSIYVHCDANASIKGAMLNTLKIYPNPVSSLLYIEHKGKTLPVTLLDNFGRRLYEGSTLEKSIDMSSFPAGIYMLKVGDVNRLVVKE